jgi:hypothetical protein
VLVEGSTYALFQPANGGRRYCSASCAGRGERNRRAPAARRQVARPPHAQLLREIDLHGCAGVARKHGVSDNTIRKWLRAYEAEATASALVATAVPGEEVPVANRHGAIAL